jgi:hypothetical protein
MSTPISQLEKVHRREVETWKNLTLQLRSELDAASDVCKQALGGFDGSRTVFEDLVDLLRVTREQRDSAMAEAISLRRLLTEMAREPELNSCQIGRK